MKSTLIASGISLALGAPAANAALVTDLLGSFTWSTDSANFTELDNTGSMVGGTNDITMNWDGNGYSASTDYTGPGSTSNISLSSTTLFFNHQWTAHDIQMFVPGSYSFDVSLGGGVPESGILNVTVPDGQLGMHLLWDWNAGLNIDVFVVLAPSSVFGSGTGYSSQFTAYGNNLCDDGTIQNCLFDDGAFGSDGKPAGDTVWMLASVDGNGDGIMGIPMAPGGPTADFNINYSANLTPTPKVPLPAAAWLFGAGLAGLIGAARRKRT